ncbi:hypothetical protein [Erwinia amylovora]|uniref:hypothetical protein n=1 Tax=Erwinia amylovora TaxID=552 RepID=UPI001443F1F9|nr:hypothetical protein [Erwinia amylovora]
MIIPILTLTCGLFTVSLDQNRPTIDGNRVEVTSTQFTGAHGDYGSAVISLKPTAITTTNRQYRVTTINGSATLEILTTETPPRTLNREICAGTDRTAHG